MGNGFIGERAERYQCAMEAFPLARFSELTTFKLDEVSPRTIVDYGAGHGFLTTYLLECFPDATIHAIDASATMLEYLPRDPNVHPILHTRGKLPLEEGSVDLVVSLAMFHHVSDKERIFSEMQRILRTGGYFALADVYHGTPVQTFFDDVVRRYCIEGHDFSFLDYDQVQTLAKTSGFVLEYGEICDVPWSFNREDDLLAFMMDLLGLKISKKVLRDKVVKHFSLTGGMLLATLPWQLGYFTLRK